MRVLVSAFAIFQLLAPRLPPHPGEAAKGFLGPLGRLGGDRDDRVRPRGGQGVARRVSASPGPRVSMLRAGPARGGEFSAAWRRAVSQHGPCRPAGVFLVARRVLGLLLMPSMIADSGRPFNSWNRAGLREEGDWQPAALAPRGGPLYWGRRGSLRAALTGISGSRPHLQAMGICRLERGEPISEIHRPRARPPATDERFASVRDSERFRPWVKLPGEGTGGNTPARADLHTFLNRRDADPGRSDRRGSEPRNAAR